MYFPIISILRINERRNEWPQLTSLKKNISACLSLYIVRLWKFPKTMYNALCLLFSICEEALLLYSCLFLGLRFSFSLQIIRNVNVWGIDVKKNGERYRKWREMFCMPNVEKNATLRKHVSISPHVCTCGINA